MDQTLGIAVLAIAGGACLVEILVGISLICIVRKRKP
jgi:hypothetical protein